MASPTSSTPRSRAWASPGQTSPGRRRSERSLLRLNQENVMQMLTEACLWVGLLSVPLSWVVWFFGPRLEVGRHVLSKITDPALKAALEEAHAERWGIFVGLWPATLLLLSLILEKRVCPRRDDRRLARALSARGDLRGRAHRPDVRRHFHQPRDDRGARQVRPARVRDADHGVFHHRARHLGVHAGPAYRAGSARAAARADRGRRAGLSRLGPGPSFLARGEARRRRLGLLHRASFPELHTPPRSRHRHLARQRARRANAGVRDGPPARRRHPQRLGPGDLAVAATPQVTTTRAGVRRCRARFFPCPRR